MNKSKIKDPNHWRKMRAAGSVEGIEAAHARANLVPSPGVTVVETFGTKPPDLTLSAGWTMDGADLVEALEADEPVPMIGRPSEAADAIAEDVDGDLVDALEGEIAEALGTEIAADVETRATLAATTVPEAARALGVHPTTVRRRLARGTYQGTRDAAGVWTVTDPAVLEAVAGQ